MEGPNYLRAAVEFLKRQSKGTTAKSLLDTALTCPKFVLPDGGKILDNGLKCLPGIIRLPYPAVVVEYYHKENYLKGISESAAEHHVDDKVLKSMTAGNFNRDKIIVVASQTDDGPIDIMVINHIPDQSRWVYTPFNVLVQSEKGSLVEALSTGKLPMDNITPHPTLPPAWFEKLVSATMVGPITAVMELVEALSFSNITAVEIPAKKMTFTEKRKNALPYDSYHMVVVNKTQKVISAGRSETGICGERRLAREHTRHGHERYYKSCDKKIWINPMVINAGVGGKIIKDYTIK